MRAGARELRRPVHRREQPRRGADASVMRRAARTAPMRCCDPRRRRRRRCRAPRHRADGARRTARAEWAASRGDLPVRVMVCHWSRTRPVLSMQRPLGDRARWRGGAARRDEARAADRREEAAVGEEARRRHRQRTGHCTRCVGRRRRCRRRPPMSKSRAPSFSKADSAACSREDLGRRRSRRRRRQSPCAARPRPTIHQSGRASPGARQERPLARDAALGVGDGAVLLAPGRAPAAGHARSATVSVRARRSRRRRRTGRRRAPRARRRRRAG